MLIDSTHRKWFLATLVILGVSTLIYVPYHLSAPYGPKGGSFWGLTFGIAGSVCMLYAGLLGARKKVPVWRVGRAQTWMRGHLWLGLVSFPLILFHAGFQFGGPLTQVLMWLFIIVLVSGVVGAALQHYVPRMMTAQLPLETIYEQLGHVRRQLVDEADRVVTSVCGPLDPRAAAPGDISRMIAEPLREFYVQQMRPFLEARARRGHPLGSASRAQGAFRQARLLVPPELHAAVDDLENICEEARQLTRQEKMHRILHDWLLLHIPLSLALLLLGAVHAVMALRY